LNNRSAAESDVVMGISRLSYCLDDDYPTVNWERHAATTGLWLEIDDQLKAGRAADDRLNNINYRLRLSKRWPRVDCISMVPGLGISVRARTAFEALRVPGMQFLEYRVNDEPFFMFYTERRVDCLDRGRSDIKYFPSSPDRVMRVFKYAFSEDRLQACDVFTVPELSDGMLFWSQAMFLTESARTAIERVGLIGFRFEELPV
jgi:hypothetical protein